MVPELDVAKLLERCFVIMVGGWVGQMEGRLVRLLLTETIQKHLAFRNALRDWWRVDPPCCLTRPPASAHTLIDNSWGAHI